MDNQRPQLDLKYYKDICPDKNGVSLRTFVTMINAMISKVPVIPVFTKYDQFLRNVKIHLEDYGNLDDNVSDVAEKQFREHYLEPLGETDRYVRLESECRVRQMRLLCANVL